MERCPSCGAELPAVAYFCPICGVKLPEGAPQEQPAPGGPQSALPNPQSEVPPLSAARQVSLVSGAQLLSPALMAGVAGGVLVGVPGTGNFSLLWMLGCGLLAVFFFHKQFERPALPNEAARLGMLSGFFGFLVAFLVAFVSFALIRRSPWGLVEGLRENFKQSVEIMKPEDAAKILDLINSPTGAAFLLSMLATIYFFSFLALSTLGALLAGALARRRQ